jgi:hypothetical protein
LVGKGSRGGKRQDWGNIDYWLISKRRSTRVPGLWCPNPPRDAWRPGKRGGQCDHSSISFKILQVFQMPGHCQMKVRQSWDWGSPRGTHRPPRKPNTHYKLYCENRVTLRRGH